MMSIERALLARAGSYMLAAKARAVVRHEAGKGCRPVISREPVALEPFFQPIHDVRALAAGEAASDAVAETPEPPERLVRLRGWIPSDYDADWKRSERFLKQLAGVTYRIGFEVAGNAESVGLTLLCHQRDLPVIAAAFYGEFARCELTREQQSPLGVIPPAVWGDAVYADYLPPPPYSHLWTRPDELHVTPLEPLMMAMAQVPPQAVGICQVLFQPVPPEHDWHHNVEVLLDLEFMVKAFDGSWLPQRYPHEGPSGDRKQMAWEVESKAHSDKPLFAAALRTAVVGAGDRGLALLRSLSTFTHLFQHGGRPLDRLTESHYAALFSGERIGPMFTQGWTYRPGFLVNSWELAGLVHLPPAGILEHRPILLETLDTLPSPSERLAAGTKVGVRRHAGRENPIHIPDSERKCHTHVLGRPGTGKSVLLEHMILQDIARGDGVVVIDPHGDLVDSLLDLLPESAIDRTIYFDPGDPEWVPIWNPLQRIPGQDMGRTADDLVDAFKSFVTGWGHRLERFFRESFFALLHLPGSTLLDVSCVLSAKSPEGERLREQILEVVEGEEPRQFWQHEFEQYRKDDLGPPKNKLSKLLVGETFPLMFSQPDSALNFRQILDDGMILLVNLSTIGPDNRGVLGCLMLSQIYLTALSRANTPAGQRRQSHLFCDEAHKFLTNALEDLVAETRKFGVSLTLAHQYTSQFKERRADALSSTGSTIIFNVNRKDAGQLTKDLRGLVTADDLINLPKYEAIVRAGTEVVRIKTLKPPNGPAQSSRSRIIAESRRRYYKRATEVREAIRRRRHRDDGVVIPSAPDMGDNAPVELAYDEY